MELWYYFFRMIACLICRERFFLLITFLFLFLVLYGFSSLHGAPDPLEQAAIRAANEADAALKKGDLGRAMALKKEALSYGISLPWFEKTAREIDEKFAQRLEELYREVKRAREMNDYRKALEKLELIEQMAPDDARLKKERDIIRELILTKSQLEYRNIKTVTPERPVVFSSETTSQAGVLTTGKGQLIIAGLSRLADCLKKGNLTQAGHEIQYIKNLDSSCVDLVKHEKEYCELLKIRELVAGIVNKTGVGNYETAVEYGELLLKVDPELKRVVQANIENSPVKVFELVVAWPRALLKMNRHGDVMKILEFLGRDEILFVLAEMEKGRFQYLIKNYRQALLHFRRAFERVMAFPSEYKSFIRELNSLYRSTLLTYYRGLIILIFLQICLLGAFAKSTFDIFNELSGGELLSQLAFIRADADSYIEKGLELYRKKDYRKALEKFLRAQELGAAGPKLKFQIARTKYRLQMYEEAMELFEHLVEQEPANREIHYYYSMCLNNFGKYEEALRHLEESLKIPGLSGQYKSFKPEEVARNKSEYRRIFTNLKNLSERLNNIEP